MRVILTVSPVPLIATFENRHVLVSTIASKSALRVVADEISREYSDFVTYFPSYEIVTAHYNRDAFEDDQREVRPETVAKVMGLFSKHYLGGKSAPIPKARREAVTLSKEDTARFKSVDAVVCDEVLIVQDLD